MERTLLTIGRKIHTNEAINRAKRGMRKMTTAKTPEKTMNFGKGKKCGYPEAKNKFLSTTGI